MSESTVILMYRLLEDKILSVVKYQLDPVKKDVVLKVPMSSDTAKIEPKNYDLHKLNLNMAYMDPEDSVLVEELMDSVTAKAFDAASEGRINFPTLIKCQNCETNFPTKYQYQRHQCDFNADKAVLKSLEWKENEETGANKVKFECNICSKRFISKNNLERHQAGHETVKDNVCEYCSKQFVSENRLRIHKENHCKKAGDISKFYRSDVTVWKCKKCHEVFSSLEIGNYHTSICSEILVLDDDDNPKSLKEEIESAKNLLGEENLAVKKYTQTENRYIEKILTEILLQCEFCNRTYSNKNLLLMHQRKHTTEKNYECVNCSKMFDSYTVASAHWLKKCSEFANLFYLPKLTYCEYCDRTFKSHEILYNHKIKKKHYTPKLHMAVTMENETNDKQESTNESTDNKGIINKLIQDVLKTLEEQNNDEHLIIQIKSEPTSDESSNIDQSVNIVQNEEKEKKRRGRKRQWQKHQTKCKKYSTTIDEGFKYQCERCIKVFNTIASLETHRANEHIASFCCDECGQTLHTTKALLIHCRAHKSLKPYVCETCGRSYSQTSHLWQHMRFHQGIKPFACPHEGCEARYTIRPDLKDHIRKVHTRERPFKCNVCNKCFLTGSVYYQHRLIHTNDRRYGCDVCQKRFFRADALNNHRRIHTNERPYPCHVCGREFRQKGDRNKHMRTQHPE